MTIRSKLFTFTGLFAAAVALAAACNTLQNLGDAGGTPLAPTGSAAEVSQGRKNAALTINTNPGNLLRFELRQQNLADPTQLRCDPLGNGPGNPWDVVVGALFTPQFFNLPMEYDYVGLIGETGYALALRVPVEPFLPAFFTQIEFSLRAVNPCANGHIAAPLIGYLPTQADFPSNDDLAARRSLINLAGGDVALIAHGINFTFNPTSTTATMNFLGPTGWLVFLRDNAFRSGRFYNISGALKGAPPAFFDTPSPNDDGFFESVQVNGDNFDLLSEPFGNTSGVPNVFTCLGAPTPGSRYAFVDLSNFDENFAPGNGEGGGAFIIRREAFLGAALVVNPNVPGPAPAPVGAGDTIPPLPSGYNEPIIININCANETDNSFNGPPGVHEIGWSIFFIHGY